MRSSASDAIRAQPSRAHRAAVIRRRWGGIVTIAATDSCRQASTLALRAWSTTKSQPRRPKPSPETSPVTGRVTSRSRTRDVLRQPLDEPTVPLLRAIDPIANEAARRQYRQEPEANQRRRLQPTGIEIGVARLDRVVEAHHLVTHRRARVEPCRPRDGIRPDLRGRRARRRRGLPRVASHYPPPAALAAPHRAAEQRHVRPHARNVHLILLRAAPHRSRPRHLRSADTWSGGTRRRSHRHALVGVDRRSP